MAKISKRDSTCFVASMLNCLISLKRCKIPLFSLHVLKSNPFAHSVPRCIVGLKMNTSPRPPPLLPRSPMCCNVGALQQQLENFLCAARTTENSELLHVFWSWPAAPRLGREPWGSREQRKVLACQDGGERRRARWCR